CQSNSFPHCLEKGSFYWKQETEPIDGFCSWTILDGRHQARVSGVALPRRKVQRNRAGTGWQKREPGDSENFFDIVAPRKERLHLFLPNSQIFLRGLVRTCLF